MCPRSPLLGRVPTAGDGHGAAGTGAADEPVAADPKAGALDERGLAPGAAGVLPLPEPAGQIACIDIMKARPGPDLRGAQKRPSGCGTAVRHLVVRVEGR